MQVLNRNGRAVSGSVLGYLCIYSVSDRQIKINRRDLEERFRDAGVDLAHLPGVIRAADVFRRASSRAEKKRVPVDKGVFLNIMVREVRCDPRQVIRHVVEETVDANDVRLSYEPVAELVLTRRGSVVAGWELVPGHREIVNRIVADYHALVGVYQGDHIRRMIAAILLSMSPTPMRASGGVYFVPEKYATDLEALERLAHSLGCEFHSLPMIDAEKNRVWVYEELTAHVAGTIKALAGALRGQEVGAGEAKRMLEQTQQIAQQVRDYEALLETNLNALRADAEILRAQLVALLDKVA